MDYILQPLDLDVFINAQACAIKCNDCTPLCRVIYE
jgi:hypothetical protein